MTNLVLSDLIVLYDSPSLRTKTLTALRAASIDSNWSLSWTMATVTAKATVTVTVTVTATAMAMAMAMAILQLWAVVGHEYAGQCHSIQVIMQATIIGIASFFGG